MNSGTALGSRRAHMKTCCEARSIRAQCHQSNYNATITLFDRGIEAPTITASEIPAYIFRCVIPTTKEDDMHKRSMQGSAVVLLTALLVMPSHAGAGPIVFSDFGAILDTVDAFRSAIGGANNGNAPGPFTTGRREINWDGGGVNAQPLVNMPKDLFLNNRGAFYEPAATTFSISGQTAANDATLARFGNINSTYPSTFTSFSSPRIFAPTNSITTEQIFFQPGSSKNIPAVTTAFGVVFLDVDRARTTSIEYFGANNKSLGKFYVPPANNGQSFLGVKFDGGELISRVAITTGNTILGPNDGGSFDVVAMDDFIFAEPKSAAAGAPEPTTLLLVSSGIVGLLWRSRSLRPTLSV